MRKMLWPAAIALVAALFAADLASAQGRNRRRRPPPPKVGEAVKDFTLKDVDGKDVSLSDFRDKKIFVLELGACT